MIDQPRESGRRQRDAAGSTTPITLLYFAWVREKIGVAREELAIPTSITTVADLVDWLRTRGPQYANAFARAEVIRVAVDQAHVKPSASLAGAREIAFFPPVTGG